jgi:hypothetical protein
MKGAEIPPPTLDLGLCGIGACHRRRYHRAGLHLELTAGDHPLPRLQPAIHDRTTVDRIADADLVQFGLVILAHGIGIKAAGAVLDRIVRSHCGVLQGFHKQPG